MIVFLWGPENHGRSRSWGTIAITGASGHLSSARHAQSICVHSVLRRGTIDRAAGRSPFRCDTQTRNCARRSFGPSRHATSRTPSFGLVETGLALRFERNAAPISVIQVWSWIHVHGLRDIVQPPSPHRLQVGILAMGTQGARAHDPVPFEAVSRVTCHDAGPRSIGANATGSRKLTSSRSGRNSCARQSILARCREVPPRCSVHAPK